MKIHAGTRAYCTFLQWFASLLMIILPMVFLAAVWTPFPDENLAIAAASLFIGCLLLMLLTAAVKVLVTIANHTAPPKPIH